MTIEKKLLAIMEGKTDLVEYYTKGTVNGKEFSASCADVYSPESILAQNPHLSADEAKAVHSHTETDDFINGMAGTEGLYDGHFVRTKSNGGYHGETKLNEEKEKKDDQSDDSAPAGQADQVTDEPAVTIENPLDPALAGSSEADDETDATDEDDQENQVKESLNDGSFSASGETGGDSIQHGDWTITLHAKDGNNGAAIVARHKDGGKKLNVFSGSQDQADKFFNYPTHLKKTVDILSGKVQEETLSEEFQEQAKALFESRLAEEVERAVAEKTATFQEEYAQKLEESISDFERNLIEHIDGYFDVLSEQWMRDNELALEAGTRSSLTESFMESIKRVFDEHYIDFPVEKIDIVESMEKTQDELKDEIVQLKLALDEKAQMLEDAKREIILETATKGMTEIDAIKLKAIVEDLGETSNEELSKRLTSLKESVFGAGKKIEIDQSKLKLSSKPLVEDAEIAKPVDSKVARYADHIRKSVSTRK